MTSAASDSSRYGSTFKEEHPRLIAGEFAENFATWIEVVQECVVQFCKHLPKGTDPQAPATFVISVMEGGVMLSRSYGSIEPFDLVVAQLRAYFTLLGKRRNKSPRRR